MHLEYFHPHSILPTATLVRKPLCDAWRVRGDNDEGAVCDAVAAARPSVNDEKLWEIKLVSRRGVPACVLHHAADPLIKRKAIKTSPFPLADCHK